MSDRARNAAGGDGRRTVPPVEAVSPASATKQADYVGSEDYERSPMSTRHTRQSSTAFLHSRTHSMAMLTNRVRGKAASGMHSRNDSDVDSVYASAHGLSLSSFSTISLSIVWALGTLGTIFCYMLAEIYQSASFKGDFPLGFATSWACHLSVLSAMTVYFIGRKRHGAGVYRFYQPFAGGQRFVVLQFFGVFSLAMSFVSTVVYVRMLQSPSDIVPGVFIALAVLASMGNVMLYISPRYFDASESVSGRPAAGDASEDTQFTFRAVLAQLRSGRNSETALVATISICQFAVGCVGIRMVALARSAVCVVLIMQLGNGLLIHYFVGCRHISGYRFLTFKLQRGIDTLFYNLSWSLYFISLLGDMLFMQYAFNNPASNLTWLSSVCLGVLGVNACSNLVLVLFLRTTNFGRVKDPAPPSLLEYGGMLIGAVAFVLTIFCTCVFAHVESSKNAQGAYTIDASHAHILHVAVCLSQALLLLLPAVVHWTANAFFNYEFTVFIPYHGNASLLVLQVFALLMLLSSIFTFVLFLLTGESVAGAASNLTGLLSVISLLFSLRKYSILKLLTASVESRVSSPQPNSPSSVPNAAAAVDDDALAATTSAALFAAAAAANAKNHGKPPSEASSVDEVRQMRYILNAEMIFAHLLAICNVMLRIVVDISAREGWTTTEIPRDEVMLVAHVLFALSVPIAHVSARDKGISIFRPFSGSSTYVGLQALAWFTYMVFMVLIVLSWIMTFHYHQLPAELLPFLRSNAYFSSMIGLLQLLPLVLTALSIVHESAQVTQRDETRGLAIEAFHSLRDALRNYLESAESEEEKAVLQLAFSTLAQPAVEEYDLPFKRRAMQLYTPAEQPEGQGTDEAVDNSDSEEEESDSDEEFFVDPRENRRRHNDARVLVILLSSATAVFYVVAAFYSHVTVFALACSACGLLLCTADCIGIQVGYGMLLHAHTGQYAVLMPFKGGHAFITRQVTGWICYALTFVITLIAGLEESGVSSAALAVTAVLSVVSQVCILDSIPLFTTTSREGQPSFLESNGEGVVAVLAFAGAISFAHVYDRVHSLFYTEKDGRAAASGESRGSRVSFVLALLSIMIAIPFVLAGLARATRQWETVARAARRQQRLKHIRSLESADSPAVQSPHTPSRTGRSRFKSGSSSAKHDKDVWIEETGDLAQQRSVRRGILALAVTNCLEVATMCLSAIIPFTFLLFVYYGFHNYSPHVMASFASFLPMALGLAVLVVLISLVPYLANVGVPQFAIKLRIMVVTYMLYGMPVMVGIVVFGPLFVHKSVGTYALAAYSIVLTGVGNYKQARRSMKFGVYAFIGYATYFLHVNFAKNCENGVSVVSFTNIKLGLGYVLDVTLLLFWLWYLPLFHGRPETTGVQRNERFAEFVQRYLFADAVKYYNFDIIVDCPEQVHMRDPKKNYLFSFHPHGVFPGTALFATMTDAWRKKIGTNIGNYAATHVASIIFNVPFVRDFNLRLGVLSVTRRTIDASLQRGNSAIIVTGGQAEMLHTEINDKLMTLVTQHHGFIRVAMTNKVPLVPLLCFGEQNVMGLVRIPVIHRITLKLLGFPFPMIPYGAFGLPLPRDAHLTLVVGKAITIPEGANPDNADEVEALADKYFEELHALFYRQREAAGYPEMELNLINDKEIRAKRRAAAKAKLEKISAKLHPKSTKDSQPEEGAAEAPTATEEAAKKQS